MRFVGLMTGLLLSVSAFAESYVGVGITIQKEKKDFYVTELIEGAPAERAGVLVGDLIFSVDGKETNGKKLDEVAGWLRGEEGKAVSLLLIHEKAGKREISVVREVIEIQCFLEGSYSLRYDDGSFTSLSGWIGSDYINLTGSRNSVSGYVKGQYMNLNVRTSTGSDYVEFSGFLRGSSVRWAGYSRNVSGYQSCIR